MEQRGSASSTSHDVISIEFELPIKPISVAHEINEEKVGCDRLVVAVSTHGKNVPIKGAASEHIKEAAGIEGRVDLLRGTDKSVALEELTEAFNEDCCPGLKEKPKIFFIQVLRQFHACKCQ